MWERGRGSSREWRRTWCKKYCIRMKQTAVPMNEPLLPFAGCKALVLDDERDDYNERGQVFPPFTVFSSYGCFRVVDL